jgi:hypothetical protein
MAALRAKTIHKITRINKVQLSGPAKCKVARKNPIKAKGKAKIVWLNLISDR